MTALPADRRARTDVLVVVLGAALFTASSVRAIVSVGKALGVPFFDWTFYAGAVNRWLAGEPIYPGAQISTLGSPAGSSYAYPPASVPLMLPFASWPVGAILWETVIVAMLLLGLWRVVSIGWPTRPLLAFGIVLAVMATLDGVMDGVAVANVNLATAGALGLVWARMRHPGPVAGVLAVIKVFPIALAAPAGGRVLARAAAIAAVICLVTLPLVGVSSWADYVTGLRATHPLCGDPAFTNYSLACVVSPVVGGVAAKWIGVAVAGVFVLIAVRSGLTFLGVAATTLAILAPATELHGHYLALVVVLVVIGFAELNMRRAQGRAGT